MDPVYTFKRVEMSYLITVEKSFPIKQNVLPQIQLFFTVLSDIYAKYQYLH